MLPQRKSHHLTLAGSRYRYIVRSIEPRHAAAFIQQALLNGWAPALPGPVFILLADNADIFLPAEE